METIVFLAKRVFGTLALSLLIIASVIMILLSCFWYNAVLLMLQQALETTHTLT